MTTHEPPSTPNSKLPIEPFKEPLKEPLKDPLQEPFKEPVKEPLKEPFKEPLKEPKNGRMSELWDAQDFGRVGPVWTRRHEG